MKILGIDEAGRGPMVGPMVMAAVMVEEKDIERLKNIGVKDSKMLTPRRREEIFEVLTNADFLRYEVVIIPPEEIDKTLNSENFNLNWLEAINSAMMINKLKPDRAIVDCPSSNTKAYADYLSKYLNLKVELIAEHKADVNYEVVSAASIIAKVTRDSEIEKIKQRIGFDLGSGYPSDPKTVDFVKKNYDKKELSSIFRKSWQSYKNILESKKQKSISDY